MANDFDPTVVLATEPLASSPAASSQPSIAGLMRSRDDLRTDHHHRAWLEHALQAAVTLEFATIPPYLCALWSIEDELHPVAKSIREILHEEMLHMALAANMLVAIGGRPQIARGAPRYPGGLPMGVHAGLEVQLAGLGPQTLRTFMLIERPAEIAAHEGDAVPEVEAPAGDETIGEFYDAIEDAFRHVQPALRVDHQVSGPLSWMTVRTLDDVHEAIALIKRQGEGSAVSPTDTGLDDLAHYYRFEEIYEGKKLVWDEAKQELVHGPELSMPAVLPMAPVPKGGYQPHEVSPEVWHLLQGFDRTYTRLLDLLQGVWARGGQASFVHSIETMFELQRWALPLMRTPIPGGGGGTYGPCFRVVRDHDEEQ